MYRTIMSGNATSSTALPVLNPAKCTEHRTSFVIHCFFMFFLWRIFWKHLGLNFQSRQTVKHTSSINHLLTFICHNNPIGVGDGQDITTPVDMKAAFQAATVPIGQILTATNDVTISRPLPDGGSVSVPATPGVPVFGSDIITTGPEGRIKINVASDDSKLSIGPNSGLDLAALSAPKSLAISPINTTPPPLDPSQTIRARTMILGVRG